MGRNCKTSASTKPKLVLKIEHRKIIEDNFPTRHQEILCSKDHVAVRFLGKSFGRKAFKCIDFCVIGCIPFCSQTSVLIFVTPGWFMFVI